MKRGEFLKNLGALFVGIAVVPVLLKEEFSKDPEEEISKELQDKIIGMLRDAIRRDIEKRMFFGSPDSLPSGVIYKGIFNGN